MAKWIISLPLWLASTTAIAAVPTAQAYWDAGQYRQAFAAAVEPAQAGDPQAEFLLGEAYRLGRSVDQDLIQASDWYARAARQGDVASAAALGELLVGMRRSGDAVPWLTLAASHNHARATAFLAAIYYTGDGAQRDLILATTLMKKAAAEGSPEARAKLAMMDDTATPVDVSSPDPVTRTAESAAPGVQLAMRDDAAPAFPVPQTTPRFVAPATPAMRQAPVQQPSVRQAAVRQASVRQASAPQAPVRQAPVPQAPLPQPPVRQAAAAPAQVAQPLPVPFTPRAPDPAPVLARTEHVERVDHVEHAEHKVRTQVGAFRLAANARRAFRLVSAQMSGAAYDMTIVQRGGLYHVLLISDGKRSARIARARLLRAGWPHFARHQAVERA